MTLAERERREKEEKRNTQVKWDGHKNLKWIKPAGAEVLERSMVEERKYRCGYKGG